MKLPPAATQGWLQLMIGQLRVFAAEGGEVLFGTNIGYTDAYDTTLEFQLMTRGHDLSVNPRLADHLMEDARM